MSILVANLSTGKGTWGHVSRLVDGNVDMIFGEHVIDIKKDDKIFQLKTDKGNYSAKKVIISTGRLGSRNIINIFDRLGVDYHDSNEIEIGVRVEMPFHHFNHIDNVFNDLKLKKKLNEKEELRSFCQDHKGYITQCVYNFPGDKVLTTLDGHIIGTDEEGGRLSPVTNIGIHHRIKANGNLQQIYDEIEKMCKNKNPIFQTMKGFMHGKVYDDVKLEKSLPSAELADLNKFIPERTLQHVKDFIMSIDKVIPGFAHGDNLVYSPSFELGWKKIKIDNNFETGVKGLYVGGDATGHFRGAMQAMVSGILIAQNIMEE